MYMRGREKDVKKERKSDREAEREEETRNEHTFMQILIKKVLSERFVQTNLQATRK